MTEITKSKKTNAKFFMTLDNSVYNKLSKLAAKRGITLQQYIRAVILPEWLNKHNKRFTKEQIIN